MFILLCLLSTVNAAEIKDLKETKALVRLIEDFNGRKLIKNPTNILESKNSTIVTKNIPPTAQESGYEPNSSGAMSAGEFNMSGSSSLDWPKWTQKRYSDNPAVLKSFGF